MATVTVPWITLVVIPPDRGRGLSGVRLGAARHPGSRSRGRRSRATCSRWLAIGSRCSRARSSTPSRVLPAVIVADALVGRRLRAALREHVALVAIYALGARCALALFVDGSRTARHVLADREAATRCRVEILESAPAHLAVVALAGGLLPFLRRRGVGRREPPPRSIAARRRAFAWLTVVTVVVLTVEVASFNLRFGGGLVRERYLFYLTPLLLCAFAAALTAATPAALVAARAARRSCIIGFWRAPIPTFEKLNVDTPASVLYDWLLSTMHGTGGARVALILAAVVVALLVLEADAVVPARPRSRSRSALAAARRAAGRDGLRVQAPLRRQRHIRACR